MAGSWRFPLGQKFRKFRFGAKWETFFLSPDRKIPRKSGTTGGAFHLVKNSENSGSGLNGKRFFGSPGWKIPGKSGTA